MKIVYRAFNGREFGSKEECQNYEDIFGSIPSVRNALFYSLNKKSELAFITNTMPFSQFVEVKDQIILIVVLTEHGLSRIAELFPNFNGDCIGVYRKDCDHWALCCQPSEFKEN